MDLIKRKETRAVRRDAQCRSPSPSTPLRTTIRRLDTASIHHIHEPNAVCFHDAYMRGFSLSSQRWRGPIGVWVLTKVVMFMLSEIGVNVNSGEIFFPLAKSLAAERE